MSLSIAVSWLTLTISWERRSGWVGASETPEAAVRVQAKKEYDEALRLQQQIPMRTRLTLTTFRN